MELPPRESRKHNSRRDDEGDSEDKEDASDQEDLQPEDPFTDEEESEGEVVEEEPRPAGVPEIQLSDKETNEIVQKVFAGGGEEEPEDKRMKSKRRVCEGVDAPLLTFAARDFRSIFPSQATQRSVLRPL